MGTKQMSKRILIVDDEKEIAGLLEDFLMVEGFHVSKAFNAKEARKHLEKEEIFLILLDIMMPDDSGFTLCKEIRRTSSIPILFLSALDDDISKIRGLSIGADDYIVKNASPGEIVARVKAVERRIGPSLSSTLSYAGVSLHTDSRTFQVGNERVNLTGKEYELMHLFLEGPNQVYTYEQILERVWGYEGGDFHTVRVHVSKLREKVQEKTSRFQISTVWGVGYKAEELIHA